MLSISLSENKNKKAYICFVKNQTSIACLFRFNMLQLNIRGGNMKYDMHFHSKEGSIDGKVAIDKALSILKSKGYTGVVVTDHNSYDGYNSIKDTHGLNILCGIEYDTMDGGHCLVILPDGIQLEELTKPGMKIKNIIDIVHSSGGIIGLSHPYDCSRLGFMNRNYKNKELILETIDFIEGVNASSFNIKNEMSLKLAEKYNKPIFSGSDSHRDYEVGLGALETDMEIRTNNELIDAVKHANFNTFKTNKACRKPSAFQKILQIRVDIGGACWFRYIKIVGPIKRFINNIKRS